MSEHDRQGAEPASGWDTYWQGAGDAGAYSGGGTSHPAVVSFWREFFGSVSAEYEAPRIVDIASGNGAVVAHAREVLGDSPHEFTCVDVAPAAIRTLEQRFPGLTGVVADARSMPLASGHYDVVTSQFGIEYAGVDAVPEACRLVAGGGRLALLVHHRDGGIYRQCAASRDAIATLRQARFLPLATAMLETGFAAFRGGDKATHEAAIRDYLPALRAAEAVMQQHGPHVADGTIVKLYRDLRDIHQRLGNYEPSEVLGWLGRLGHEIEAYQDRMDSMCRAAIDADGFARLCRHVNEAGLAMERSEPLTVPDTGTPLAWALIAEKARE